MPGYIDKEDKVLVQFIHRDHLKRPIIGQVTRYHYGRRQAGERFEMHRADAEAEAGRFRVITDYAREARLARKKEAAAAQRDELQEKIEGAFDFSVLHGIGASTVSKLHKSGVFTPEDFHRLGAEGLKGLLPFADDAKAANLLLEIEQYLAGE
jgi:predicted flap endonuclease-1-like 5' DNA nuclease